MPHLDYSYHARLRIHGVREIFSDMVPPLGVAPHTKPISWFNIVCKDPIQVLPISAPHDHLCFPIWILHRPSPSQLVVRSSRSSRISSRKSVKLKWVSYGAICNEILDFTNWRFFTTWEKQLRSKIQLSIKI